MVFDEECQVFNKELEALASTLPSVSLVEETEERLMERIALLEVFVCHCFSLWISRTGKKQ